jgi:hypothetical protein
MQRWGARAAWVRPPPLNAAAAGLRLPSAPPPSPSECPTAYIKAAQHYRSARRRPTIPHPGTGEFGRRYPVRALYEHGADK